MFSPMLNNSVRPIGTPFLLAVYPPLLALFATNTSYTIFANDDGVAYAIDISEPEWNEMELAELASIAVKTTFHLYTR